MLAMCEAVDKAPGTLRRPPVPVAKWLTAVEVANFINAMPYRFAFSRRNSRVAFFLPVGLRRLEEAEKGGSAVGELLDEVKEEAGAKSSSVASSDATPRGLRGTDFVFALENRLTMKLDTGGLAFQVPAAIFDV